jgi:tRNA nucleotidyltransferase/poly(A) polymerase
MKDQEISFLERLPFKDSIKEHGGQIYAVGGWVRDQYLNLPSKDLDIIITNISFSTLQEILNIYGKIKLVGQTFGILKFRAFGSQDEIDIALPRKDRKGTGSGHKAIISHFDESISIEEDLARRDFTINSIAMNSEGNIIDPFGGIEDIKNRILRATSSIAFIDDPLRMLRGIAQAARFRLHIEKETFKMIVNHSKKIKEITAERYYIELEKIITKGGDTDYALSLLTNSGLYYNMFGFDSQFNIQISKVKTIGEFLFLIFAHKDNPESIVRDKITTNNKILSEVAALTLIYKERQETFSPKCRHILAKAYKIFPEILDSILLDFWQKWTADHFKFEKYPKSIFDLKINGSDLINLGFEGKKIGQVQESILDEIYHDRFPNNREQIIKYIKTKTW